jgi:hypothetical protein
MTGSNPSSSALAIVHQVMLTIEDSAGDSVTCQTVVTYLPPNTDGTTTIKIASSASNDAEAAAASDLQGSMGG